MTSWPRRLEPLDEVRAEKASTARDEGTHSAQGTAALGFRRRLYDDCVRSLADRPALLLGLGAILAVAAFHLWITPSNPPGYHRDEAALSLNAYTLAAGLRDEDGARFPLFFRSFDDYKSPVYPYLLAGAFELTWPGSGRRSRAVRRARARGCAAARRARGRLTVLRVATVVAVLAGLAPSLLQLGLDGDRALRRSRSSSSFCSSGSSGSHGSWTCNGVGHRVPWPVSSSGS